MTQPAPAGSDQWTIVASGSGKTFSESNVTINVIASQTATGSFSLNPIATNAQWVVGTQTSGGASPDVPVATTFANGSGTPIWNGTGYSCPSPSNGGCYEPILNNDGTAMDDTASLQLLDAAGNVIIPTAQGKTVSGAPNVPIYLDSSGGEREVIVRCTNDDIQWMNAGAAASAPIAQANLITSGGGNQLANGFYNRPTGGAAGYLIGPGNALTDPFEGTNVTGFNSPVTGQDTATTGKGTDFSGAAIVDGIYGNNGALINYDGAHLVGGPFPLTTVSTPTFCAVDFQSPSGSPHAFNVATLYLGLAEGNITWGSNGRHYHSNLRSRE
ncbi:MAG: hypothetical protein JO199_10615 [Candidatus Eremiobacteraeota bacterium]|nr:hypothetical protein [Candidatus Eremiobacteraeota bacterium]